MLRKENKFLKKIPKKIVVICMSITYKGVYSETEKLYRNKLNAILFFTVMKYSKNFMII